MRKVMIAALLAASVATPAAAQLKNEIQKVVDEFSAAFNRGDAEAIAANYTDDAVALPPNADMVKGKPQILEYWKKTVGAFTDLKSQTLDVKRLAPRYAREIGSFSFNTKDNPPHEITGKYVVLWQRVAGRWKLNTDIWNMNK